MKQILTNYYGKIVKMYLRNEQNFSARIVCVDDTVVYARSQYADIHIRLDEIIAVTKSFDTPLTDVPTKNLYHPNNKRY